MASAKPGTNGQPNIRTQHQPGRGSTLTKEKRDQFLAREDFFRYVQWIARRAMARTQQNLLKSTASRSWAIFHLASVTTAPTFIRSVTFSSRLVRGRAAGTVFQGRRVHDEMGTELGHSTLQLAGDARGRFRLVAGTRAR